MSPVLLTMMEADRGIIASQCWSNHTHGKCFIDFSLLWE